jgi:dihydroneopterin aldolase
MLTIHLNKLRFFAYHGLFQEETVAGEEFELDVHLQYMPVTLPIAHIKETVDYTGVYKLIKERMANPELFLETLAYHIASDILTQFTSVLSVDITVTKLRPPIVNFTGNISVQYVVHRSTI